MVSGVPSHHTPKPVDLTKSAVRTNYHFFCSLNSPLMSPEVASQEGRILFFIYFYFFLCEGQGCTYQGSYLVFRPLDNVNLNH